MKALSNPETPFVFNIAGPNPVLLVDDDDDAILLIQLLLKRAKVTAPVHITTDGEQAIAYFQSRLANPGAELLPLIVFLDLKLPRRNGFEVLKWLRAQPALNRLPVMIMSSSNRPLDMQTAQAGGADFYCEKYPALEDLILLFDGKTFFPPLPSLDFG